MTNIPPHKIAQWITHFIDFILEKCNIQNVQLLEEIIYIIIVVAITIGIGWVVSKIAVLFTNKMRWFKLASKSGSALAEKALIRVSRIIPPVIFLSLIPFAFSTDSKVLSIIIKVTIIYLIITFILAINGILNYLWRRFDEKGNTRNHPLKGLPQIAKGFMWIIGIILIVSIIVNKSPITLFTGLGAFAAVVMLVFKDSILGLVAGIQLSQNDMLRVGDWIVVPGTPANGIVADVSLTVVKVKNWDNTLAMLPPYTLVSTSFQNWRAMKESGLRQINRSYNISSKSIHSPSPKLIEKLKTIPLLTDYLNIKLSQQENGITENTQNSQGAVNGTIETNLGIFRAYLTLYMLNHPLIANDAIMIVNELEPSPEGIPIRLYCYTLTTDWVSYESIQSELFEHVALMAPQFELELFQFPTDIQIS